MPHSLREAIAAFRRAPLLVIISIVAVSLSLFVIGLFGLTAYNIQATLDAMEERVEVVAYLSDDATLDQARRAEQEIRGRPEVLDVRFVTRTEALATAMQELPEFQEAFSGLETNPLPASLEVRMQPGYRTPAATESLAEHVLTFPFVEDVHFGRDWVEKIVALQRIAGGATLIIGGAFAAVAGIIIATAVRIAVFARREEIEIMRLVGATDGFIRRPFLIEGFLAGIIGALTAVALTYLAYHLVNLTLMRILWIPEAWLVATIVVGAGYGFLASAIAVRRHLRVL